MSFVGTLRDYQQEAVDRMTDRGQMLLAITMGGGKSPTTIAAVESLHEEGEVDRCLVVVPASLKYQWMSEIKKFTNAHATLIDGTAAKRKEQWRHSIRSRYVVVNPETLLNDRKLIGDIQCIAIDEATMIKSMTTKRSRMMKRLGKTVPYRFALTGQPIENRPEELFSIMAFVDPDVLGTFEQFDRTFIIRNKWGKPTRYRNLDLMHRSMQECMVRLTREDIADQLPRVIPQFIPIPFDKKGATLYRAITQDLLEQIADARTKGGGKFDLWAHYNDPEGNEAQGQVMARLTVLRMLCDNPALISRSSSNYLDLDVKAGSQYANEVQEKGWLEGVTAAPKLSACLDYIQNVLEADPKNKVVLFSFFKDNLRLIQEATAKMTDSVLFMGGMDAAAKDASKQQFANDPDTRLFLSSEAGGYGVDLPMANFLISYDLPWSSGKLEQREARIIRLSSEFEHVTIATFVMAGSVEERMYQMLNEKKKTNEAMIDGKHQDSKAGMDLTLDSLTSFLRESSV